MLYTDMTNDNMYQQMQYIKFSTSLVGYSGNSVLLTSHGEIYLKDNVNKLVRVFNGNDYSHCRIIRSNNKLKLFRVTLSDGRWLDCSIHSHFLIDGNSASLSLYDLVRKYRKMKGLKPNIYTNIASNTETFDYITTESFVPVNKKDTKDFFDLATFNPIANSEDKSYEYTYYLSFVD